jgi:hypothetical protein
MGDKRARDDKPTAQTKNRCCILDDLSHRHRSRCNSYIESSKTRTNRAVTVVRGASALAAAAAPGHHLKVNVVSIAVRGEWGRTHGSGPVPKRENVPVSR